MRGVSKVVTPTRRAGRGVVVSKSGLVLPFTKEFGLHSLQKRCQELAHAIHLHYLGRQVDEIALVGILEGGTYFATLLSLEMSFPHRLHLLYPPGINGEWSYDLNRIRSREIVLVDDVCDSGATLHHMRRWLLGNGRRVTLCVMADKQISKLEPDWVGFNVPSRWLFGLGMDLEDGRLRNMPFVGSLDLPEDEARKILGVE